MARFEDLLHKTITDITVISSNAIGDDRIIFTLDAGKQCSLYTPPILN